MVEYQVESLRFVGRRTDGKLEYLRSLCHYIEWQDMAEVQRSWFKEWLADCGKERVRLAATGFALASGDFLPLPCSCTRDRRQGGQSRQCLVPDRPTRQRRRRRVRPILYPQAEPVSTDAGHKSKRVTSPKRGRRTGKLDCRRNALMVHRLSAAKASASRQSHRQGEWRASTHCCVAVDGVPRSLLI
jgi:hypothetical protein